MHEGSKADAEVRSCRADAAGGVSAGEGREGMTGGEGEEGESTEAGRGGGSARIEPKRDGDGAMPACVEDESHKYLDREP